MTRETVKLTLDGNVEVEVLARANARARFAYEVSVAAGKDNMARAMMEATQNVMPILIVAVIQNGHPIKTSSLWDWLLDNMESIDPLLVHMNSLNLIGTADPNVLSGSPITPEPATESRPTSGSDTSIAAPTE